MERVWRSGKKPQIHQKVSQRIPRYTHGCDVPWIRFGGSGNRSTGRHRAAQLRSDPVSNRYSPSTPAAPSSDRSEKLTPRSFVNAARARANSSSIAPKIRSISSGPYSYEDRMAHRASNCTSFMTRIVRRSATSTKRSRFDFFSVFSSSWSTVLTLVPTIAIVADYSTDRRAYIGPPVAAPACGPRESPEGASPSQVPRAAISTCGVSVP